MLPEIIHTDRLILRKPIKSDAKKIYKEWLQDEEVAKYQTWKIYTSLSQAKLLINEYIKEWEKDIGQPYIITFMHKPIGLFYIYFNSNNKITIGYDLSYNYWNKGFMSEVLKTIINEIFETTTYNKIEAGCDCENIASIKVLEKCGLKCKEKMNRYLILPNIGNEPRNCFKYSIDKDAK